MLSYARVSCRRLTCRLLHVLRLPLAAVPVGSPEPRLRCVCHALVGGPGCPDACKLTLLLCEQLTLSHDI